MNRRRWARQRRARSPSADKPSRRSQIPRWIEVAAAAVVVIGGAYAVIQFLADSTEDLIANSAHGSVEVSQVVLANGKGDTRLVDGALAQTDASTPQIDSTVRNPGKELALLTQARITIEDSERLAMCAYNIGDMIPSSKDYALELPVMPTPRERVVVRPLHQEVQPGAVDRFRILFKVENPGLNNYLYALRVELVTDRGPTPVEVGRFVIGLQSPPYGGSPILPGGETGPNVSGGSERLASTWCLRRNLAAVKRLLGEPGKRSPTLAGLLPFRFGSWWSSFADPRPASAAVEALLHSPVNEAPLLAVFAAEQTGDDQLVARTRKRAAQLLLLTAEEMLSSPFNQMAGSSTIPARQSLSLSPSARALDALREGEVRQAEFDEGKGSRSGGGD